MCIPGHNAALLRQRLAAERSRLWWTMLGLEEETLCTAPISGMASAGVEISRLAVQEARLSSFLLSTVAVAVEDSQPSVAAGRTIEQMHSWDRSLAACLTARKALLACVAHLPDLTAKLTARDECADLTPAQLAHGRAASDAVLAAAVETWREQNALTDRVGPKSLILAALRAGRKEMLTTLALTPEERWALLSTEENRTVTDDIQNLATGDRHQTALMAALQIGRSAAIGEAERRRRSNVTWPAAWRELHASRQALLQMVTGMNQGILAGVVTDPQRGPETVYRGLCRCIEFDRAAARRWFDAPAVSSA